MVRLALLLALQAVLASTALAHPPLNLEVDGQQFGVFARLVQDREAGGTVTLERGWMSPDFVGLWWPELGDGLKQGAHQFPDECVGRRVDLTQVLAPDARGRLRSWTLMGACPLACEVQEAQDGGRIIVTSLTLRVQGIGRAM